MFMAGIGFLAFSKKKPAPYIAHTVFAPVTAAEKIDSPENIKFDFNNKSLAFSAIPQNYYVLKGSTDKEFYLYVTLKGSEAPSEKQRLPLNISLVIDRSGSMSGDKIKYARKAADFVIDQLNSEDMLSIVDYDDAVEVLSASAAVKNKEVLHQKVSGMYDRGSTNLTGGLMEGYRQVESTKQAKYINRVLLLSDGLANTGITEPSQIKQIVQKKFREQGIAVSTFGVGADYNEDLMTDIAENGGANYYFIANADEIPGIFAKELNGLLSVVAQNTKLKVAIPSGFSCEKVYGYPYAVKDGKVEVNFNDVYSKEEKNILIKFTSATAIAEPFNFVCEVSYEDAKTMNKEILAQTVAVQSTTDVAQIAGHKNKIVDESIALFHSTELFDEAIKEIEKGNYNEGRLKTQELNVYLDSVSLKVGNTYKLVDQKTKVLKYNSNITEYESKSAEEQKFILKESKSDNYSTRKSKFE